MYTTSTSRPAPEIAWRAPASLCADHERHGDPGLGRRPRRSCSGDEHGDRILDADLLALGRIGSDDAAFADVVTLLDHRVDHAEPRRLQRLPSLLGGHPGDVGDHGGVVGRVDEQLHPATLWHHRAGDRIGAMDDAVLEPVVLLLDDAVGQVAVGQVLDDG